MKRKLLLSVRNALLVTTITALVPALVIIVVTGIEHGGSREEAARAEAHRQVESLVQIHLEIVLGVRRVLETLGAMASFREANRSVQTQVLTTLLSMNPEKELPIVSTAWDRLREGDNAGAFSGTMPTGACTCRAARSLISMSSRGTRTT